MELCHIEIDFQIIWEPFQNKYLLQLNYNMYIDCKNSLKDIRIVYYALVFPYLWLIDGKGQISNQLKITK
ncbi:unnamed protein product [Paramecium octaurelia]|uniref:Uncharacterized protein n=1 Tax=Paramecium octaurelia TaxID=43137 RepID=A0A8S1T3X1_PAROT|nr:unnamed protein product [Paramecium octaurelia]